MKIVIAADEFDLIKDVVVKSGHAVVAITDDPGHLRDLILHHTPHLVLVEKSEKSVLCVSRLETLFRAVRFCVLGYERGTTWTQLIRQALGKGRLDIPWPPSIPETREIILDPRYYSFTAAVFHGRREAEKVEGGTLDCETLRLREMLQCAKTVRTRANLYLEAQSFVGAYEWRDTIHRTVDGSFEGPVWARDQLSRSVGYLALHVPGADLDGLPTPVNDSAQLRYVSYYSTTEFQYALLCLALFGCSTTVAKHLYRAAHWCLGKESVEQLTEISLGMAGLAFTMENICASHANAVDWLLDAKTVSSLGLSRPRALNRSIQIFASWWGFRRILNDHHRLANVLHDIQIHEFDTQHPRELELPNFAQFLEAMTASSETNQN